MNKQELDMKDPHDLHAFFSLCFVCDHCNKMLPENPTLEFSTEPYFIDIATRAKKEGWYCPPADKGDVLFCLCPECKDSVKQSVS